MRIKQKEIPFKNVNIKLTSKEEANALREIVDYFRYEDVEAGAISEEAYNLTVKLSDAFTDCIIEVPLSNTDKKVLRKHKL